MFTSQPRVAGVLTRSAATVRKGTRRLTVIAAAPAFGLSLLLGSAPVAAAEPTTECSQMAHPPAGQTDPGSGNPLTRPGQLGGVNQQPAPNGDMPMDCPSIGHG